MRAADTLSITDNRLLAALPDSALDRVRLQLEPVCLKPGKVLSEPGQVMGHLFIPTTAMAGAP